jgi:hypothetical protein
LVGARGFEPPTPCAQVEPVCGRERGTSRAGVRGRNPERSRRSPHSAREEGWSGRLDLNQRPPAPKAGALPGCATPRHSPGLFDSKSLLRRAPISGRTLRWKSKKIGFVLFSERPWRSWQKSGDEARQVALRKQYKKRFANQKSSTSGREATAGMVALPEKP